MCRLSPFHFSHVTVSWPFRWSESGKPDREKGLFSRFFPEGGKTSVHRLIFQAQIGKNLNILSTSRCTVRYRETVDFYRFTADQFHVQSERILDQRENGVKIGILSVKTIFHLQCKNTYHLRKV